MKSETEEHKALRAIGEEYEEFVLEKWPLVYPFGWNGIDDLHRCIGIQNQYLYGDTEEGVEIKLDRNIVKTKRIYIETQEKANENNANYVDSSIYSHAQAKYYLIGNYREWWIFDIQELRQLDKLIKISKPYWIYVPQPTGTSIGFCINRNEAEIQCLDYQYFGQK